MVVIQAYLYVDRMDITEQNDIAGEKYMKGNRIQRTNGKAGLRNRDITSVIGGRQIQ